MELRLGDFKVQGLASTAWAFATAGQSDTQLFAVLGRATGWHNIICDFNAQNLTNTAWAFATVDLMDMVMFDMLARAAERHTGELMLQDLSSIVWSSATSR